MASYFKRAKEAVDQLNPMKSDADPYKQLNKSQCTYLYKIIEKAFTINAPRTDSSPREDPRFHREENSGDTSHPYPDSQRGNFPNPGSPGGEILEHPDNKNSAEWRELCFAIEHAQVLIQRCCNGNVLEAAILQTDLTEEISTLVSFFSSTSESSDDKPHLADKCKEDRDALQILLEAKKQEMKEQDQGVLAAYLLERFYHDSTTHTNNSQGSRKYSLHRTKDSHRPTRRNNWFVDTSKLGSVGQRLGKGASGFIYETTWLGEKFTRKFFLGTSNSDFEVEAAALVDLRHLNIVHTFCWAKDMRSYSLVLEMFGTDLSTYVQKKNETERKNIAGMNFNHLAPFESEKWLLPAIRIMLQIAAGMKYLHDKGVAHGDLEPNNILVKPVVNPSDASHHLHVKVVDFGLTRTRWWRAQYADEDGKERDAIGFQWKAPEQFTVSAADDPSDARKAPSTKEIDALQVADVYSFASLCLYILTGESPVKDSESVGGQAPYKLPQNSCCPVPLKELLQRCWTGDLKKRPLFDQICENLRQIHADHIPKFKKVDLSSLEMRKRKHEE